MTRSKHENDDAQISNQVTDSRELSEVIDDSMRDYTLEVVLNRAIPDLRDGLKPVQRRLIWQTHRSTLGPTSKHMKLAKLSGLCMTYHPHGSGSISAAAVALSQDWVKRVPLIDIGGNNGSIDGASAAADRYIEARQAPATAFLTDGLSQDAVDLIDNFDGTEKEPRVLPASFPVLLSNGAEGMAVGLGTHVLPHNPVELLDAALVLLEDVDASDADLVKIVKGPDFPTGGELIDPRQSALSEMKDGKASYTLRARVRINDDHDEPNLEIYEMPWSVTVPKLMTSVGQALEQQQLTNAIEIRNEDDTEPTKSVSIKVIFKKGTSKEMLDKVLAYLYDRSCLELRVSANNTMISHGRPSCIGIKGYLLEFVRFRAQTLKRVWTFDKAKAERDLELVDAYISAIEHADHVIALAQKSDCKDTLIDSLVTDLDITLRQAKCIADMQVFKFSRSDAELGRLKTKRDSLDVEISKLSKLIDDDATSHAALATDIKRVRDALSDKFKRRTRCRKNVSRETVDFDTDDFISDKKTCVVIGRDLTMRQLGMKAFDNQISGHANDVVWHAVMTQRDYVIAVSENGMTVTKRVNDIQHAALDQRLDQLSLSMRDLKITDHFVTGCIANDDDSRVVMISKHGYVKVCKPSALCPNLNTRRYMSKAGRASGLKFKDDSIVWADNVNVDEMPGLRLEISMMTDDGKCVSRKRHLDLSRLIDRHDSAGNSGARMINCGDGSFVVKDVKVDVMHNDDNDQTCM